MAHTHVKIDQHIPTRDEWPLRMGGRWPEVEILVQFDGVSSTEHITTARISMTSTLGARYTRPHTLSTAGLTLLAFLIRQFRAKKPKAPSDG